MSSTRAARRTLGVRHLQFARAVLAAIAAVMVTFTADHSAAFGLAVFSGFAITTGLVLLMAAWVTVPVGGRWTAVALGAITLVAGMVGGLVALRSTTMFFVLVIAWAVVTGVLETVAGARALRRATPATTARSEARDTLTVGILTLVLAVALAVVPSGFALQYYIADAGRSFTLTGTAIAVGLFGAYAAILTVFLAIAALSPRRSDAQRPASVETGGAP